MSTLTTAFCGNWSSQIQGTFLDAGIDPTAVDAETQPNNRSIHILSSLGPLTPRTRTPNTLYSCRFSDSELQFRRLNGRSHGRKWVRADHHIFFPGFSIVYIYSSAMALSLTNTVSHKVCLRFLLHHLPRLRFLWTTGKTADYTMATERDNICIR